MNKDHERRNGWCTIALTATNTDCLLEQTWENSRKYVWYYRTFGIHDKLRIIPKGVDDRRACQYSAPSHQYYFCMYQPSYLCKNNKYSFIWFLSLSHEYRVTFIKSVLPDKVKFFGVNLIQSDPKINT